MKKNLDYNTNTRVQITLKLQPRSPTRCTPPRSKKRTLGAGTKYRHRAEQGWMKESTSARHGAQLLLEGPPAVSARLMKAGRRAFREEPVCSAALVEPAAIHLHYTRPHATAGQGEVGGGGRQLLGG